MVATEVVERLAAVTVVLEQDRRETVNDTQRRAQVVRDGIRKAVELSQRVLVLGRALGELAAALFEVGAQLGDVTGRC